MFYAVFNYKSITREHESAFEIEYEDLVTAVSALTSHEISDNAVNVSNWIVALFPEQKLPFSNVEWSVDFKSKWVAKSVLRRLEPGADLEVRQYMEFLRRVPEAKSLAGAFFEPIAHRTIAETIAEASARDSWTLGSPNSPHFLEPEPTFRISTVSLDVQLPKFNRETVELRSIADLSTTLENDRYYIPKDPGFPLFDSFIVDLDYSHKSAILWVLQVSTSQPHGGSAQGYREIRTIVRTLKEELGDHPPPRKAPKLTDTSRARVVVRYLLVVPKGDTQDLQ